ncbi:hypothetical protein [Spirosoma luteum]|uniref:hypothetical protein n=1 Tax=Spirosoma luteum TaxID=431553 RepID=UPI00037C0BD0|nr:hypothetical protein [Spirosoma luteum]
MKNISRWASRHTRTAILLLVICEVGNAVNGLLLGMNLLDDWSEGGLLLSVAGLLTGAFFLQTQSARVASMPYWVGRRWLFGAFMTNFFLFVLLGGLWASGVQTPTASHTAWGSREIIMRSDTLVRPKDARSTNPAYYEERTVINEQPVGNQAGKRVGFVLLFLLGIILSGYAVGLACNLACAGNGAFAFVVALLGTGILAGSFFLLSRAFGKVVKPWKQMNRLERKRTYVRALFLLGGFFALSILLGRIFN